MSSWKGKSRGGFIGHLFFVLVLKYLSLSIAYFFLRFVALYFLFFTPKAFKAIYDLNYNRLGFGFFRSIANVYTCFYTFGKILVDKITMMLALRDDFQHDSIGMDNIRKIAEENRGGVLITSHFGGWQSAAFFLDDSGIKPKLVMMEAEHEKIKQVFENRAKKFVLDVIPMTEDLSHIFAIAKALKNKEIISIQGDRILPGSKTIKVPFLGKEASFPVGPFAVIAKFNVPVSFIFSIKTGKTHYKCIASPTIKLSDHPEIKKPRDKERFLIEQYALNLEKQVLQHPEQWFNFYDFWQ